MKIPNKSARHLAIYCSGLHADTSGPSKTQNLLALIKYLGYVQQDPIQVVARAHDHILWSRNTNYRPEQLESLLEKDRLIFEHFGHDACVFPMECLPYWQRQFKRKADLFKNRNGRNNLLGKSEHKKLIARITNEGPLSSSDFNLSDKDKQRATWSKPAHKQTLDHLWLTGGLAVAKRDKFKKFYDLAERVYPQELIDKKIADQDRMTWLSTHALNRLGFATHSEIKRFWDASTLDETKAWCQANSSLLQSLSVESSNGSLTDTMSLTSLEPLLNVPPLPSKRLRILNPFDPLIRDRQRLEQLFGFEYRIEMYVPPAKRKYGYYVYPLLEFDTFVGRLEVRHDRQSNTIVVDNLWHEPNIKFGKQRMQRLQSELERLRRFRKAISVVWSK